MSAEEEKILGKRERGGEIAGSNGAEGNGASANEDVMDDSDEEIGPMPMPEGAGTVSGARKKRKGA